MKESVKKLLACDIEKYVDDGEDCGQDLIDVVIELRKVTQEPSLQSDIKKVMDICANQFRGNLKKMFEAVAEYEQTKEKP